MEEGISPQVAPERTVLSCARAKGHAEPADIPQDRDQAGDEEALRQHGEHVLLANETAVEQREAGQCHEQHQRRGGHHPGVMAGTGGVHDRNVLTSHVAVGVLQAGGRVAVGDVSFKPRHALFEGRRRQVGGGGGRSRGGGGRHGIGGCRHRVCVIRAQQ